MNLSILFITILIFINTIGYGTFELKNKNKLGGIIIYILSTSMIIFVNYSMFSFK